ncbi:unnamed protein product [Boreogadus saida]
MLNMRRYTFLQDFMTVEEKGPPCASCPTSLAPGDGHRACFRCLGAEHVAAALVAPAACRALPEEGLLSRHLFFSPSVDLAEAIDIFRAELPDAQDADERFEVDDVASLDDVFPGSASEFSRSGASTEAIIVPRERLRRTADLFGDIMGEAVAIKGIPMPAPPLAPMSDDMQGECFRTLSSSRRVTQCLLFPPVQHLFTAAGGDPSTLKAPVRAFTDFTNVEGWADTQVRGIPRLEPSLAVLLRPGVRAPPDRLQNPTAETCRSRFEQLKMASSAPKRPGVCEEENVVQGYLHDVTPVRSAGMNGTFFNFILQTSRDEYRRCVVFGAEKHVRFVQAADDHTPLKLSKVQIPSKVGPGLVAPASWATCRNIHIDHASTVEELVSIGFDYKEHKDFRTLTVAQVAGLKPKDYVGKIQAKVVWLQAGSKMVYVHGTERELKECHVADRTGKISLSLWGELIGQVEQDESYVLTNLSFRKWGDLTTTKDTTIRVSEEEVVVPEYVAMLRLEVKQQEVEQEVEQEVLTTVKGPVCGVKLADQWQCSSCHKWQLAFNLTAINHRCEACGLLQRVGSYVQAANGTVKVNKGNVKLTLTLTSTVLMTYLSQNDLQELLADVQLVEEHFLEDLDAKKYPMPGPQRGYCLIVNNFDFSHSSPYLSNRTGTDIDAESLRRVSTWLGFQVEVVQDATREEMLSSMRELARRDHSGMDCVACVVLSHGLKGGVYGVDGGVFWLEELTECLNGVQCPSLIGKPKLFFIQACQGIEEKKAVPVPVDGPTRPEVSDQTDRPSGPGVNIQTDGPCSPCDIYSDAVVASGSLPSMADLLIVMSTPPYVPGRNPENGTLFIQSLCQNLERFVPRHNDLVSILKEVIQDVRNNTNSDIWRPIYFTTLRKLVVFPVRG